MSSMLKPAAFLIALCSTAPAPANMACRNPPPIFHCEDWRKDGDGRLVSLRPIRAGLMEMEENGYLGDHTIIDGTDYTEALKRQCGDHRLREPSPDEADKRDLGWEKSSCANPPPVFECAEWQAEDGVLVAKRSMTVGLMKVDEGSYIGGHTLIGGLDYDAILRQQCSRPGATSDEPRR